MESGFYKEILSKLQRLIRKEHTLFAIIGIQVSLILFILVFTSFSFLEMILNHSSLLRTIIFFILLIVTLSSFGFLFLRPLYNLFSGTNYSEAALKVGKRFPFIKDDLLNALQLVSVSDGKTNYSHSLIDAAFRNVYERTKNVQFDSIVNFKKARELFLYLAVISVFCSVLFIFVPGMQAASYRLVNFNQEFIPPQKYSFEVQPGDIQVTKGDNVHISVKVSGGFPSSVYLAMKSEEQTDFENHRLTADSLGEYNFEYRSVRSSFKYFAFAEDSRSDEYNIEVIDRPIIKTLDVTVTSPAYSKIPQLQQRDNGNVTALKGTRVELKLSSTKELKEAELNFDDTASVKLNTSSTRASGNFRINKDNSYKIIITDKNGNKNLSPITYLVKVLNDDYPTIEVVSPNKNVSLGNDNRLPLLLRVTDDFGFSKLLLHYKLSASRYEPPHKDFTSVEIPLDKNLKEQNINHIWNLTNLSLGTDDVVTYYLEVFDNDNVSGPKSAVTQTYNIRVPSLDEILAGVDESHSNIEQELRETIQEASELQKNLEKINQDLKQDKREITWQEKEKIEDALNKFEQLQEKIQKASDEFDQLKEDLQNNQLLSKETLEKYMELQELMDELTSDEMKKALERLREMLQNMNRQQTQEAMQEFTVDEEKFKKSVERTLNLLKRIQIEQKVDELLKRSEMMTEKQEELLNQTEQSDLSNSSENKELSEKQDQLSKDIENFSEELEKLSEKMKELSDMPQEELDKLMEEFEKQKNQERSDEASRNINRSNKSTAMENQEQVKQNFKQMSQMMNDLQSAMMQQNQMQAFIDMMKILDNLLSLSKHQEDLRNESKQLDPGSSSFNDIAQKQQSTQKNLEKTMQQMSELSQKTFAITPEMGRALGNALREMQKSIQSLQNRSGSMSAINQGESMRSLNEAAALLKGAMESMAQGSGKGGLMSLMQQLQQLSGQQMSLNNLTQMLQQMQQGNLNQQQQAELQRLGQQQDMIRKSIEQLNKEAREQGKSKSLGGNLEDIVRQMQEVVKDMNTERLDDDLIQKQERILSRMLDAQRSINERDFERNRESHTGHNITRESPSGPDFSSERGKDKIKDELNKAVKEGFTRDYENLIRKYYEALQKENHQQ
jgi:hypothetical protein